MRDARGVFRSRPREGCGSRLLARFAAPDLSFAICHSSPAPLTIAARSNDSVHCKTDAELGRNPVLRCHHHFLFNPFDARWPF